MFWEEFGIGCGGNHGGVIGGKRPRWEIHRQAILSAAPLEDVAQFVVRRYSSRDEKSGHVITAGRSQSLAYQIFHHRALKRSDQVEDLLVAMRKVVFELRLRDVRQGLAADLD